MASKFIVNEKGEKTTVVLSLEEYQSLVKQPKHYELNNEYKLMIYEMVIEEENGTVKYISYPEVKNWFLSL